MRSLGGTTFADVVEELTDDGLLELVTRHLSTRWRKPSGLASTARSPNILVDGVDVFAEPGAGVGLDGRDLVVAAAELLVAGIEGTVVTDLSSEASPR